MKRSEMIEIMGKAWMSNGVAFSSNPTEILDAILIAQEKAGMLPPRRKDLTMSMVLKEIYLHEWEPEDE